MLDNTGMTVQMKPHDNHIHQNTAMSNKFNEHGDIGDVCGNYHQEMKTLNTKSIKHLQS